MENKNLQSATFGAGCFWGVEEEFRKVKGVVETAVGYMGGNTPNPTYEQVCTDKTGHAEVVQLRYDPRQVSYEKLLEIFWEIHDPTAFNRQGPDIGTQYRSVIFFHDTKQETAAQKSKADLEKSGKYKNKIVTEIISVPTFWRAEEYHQKYLEKRGLKICP